MRVAAASRIRLLLLLLFAAFGIGALFAQPAHLPILTLLAVLAGLAPAYAMLRDPGLALAAVLSPLPCLLWPGASSYPLGLGFAVLLAASFRNAALKNENRFASAKAVFSGAAGMLLFAAIWTLRDPVRIDALLASLLPVCLLLPAYAWASPLSESAITRGNRQRESWAFFSRRSLRLLEPRWSLAITAAAVVLAVLGYFHMPQKAPALDWLSLLAAAAILFVSTRDARAALGALAASALLLLYGGGANPAQFLFLLLALALAGAAAGPDVPLAWTRALEGQGAALLAAGLSAAAAGAILDGMASALAALASLAAALILFPTFTGALHVLAPRRRKLEDLYKIRAS